jgi:hypothetical protein
VLRTRPSPSTEGLVTVTAFLDRQVLRRPLSKCEEWCQFGTASGTIKQIPKQLFLQRQLGDPLAQPRNLSLKFR